MKRKIILPTGVLLAVTGLAGAVHLQSAVASQAETGEITLSGDSLDLESRTVEDDYQRFFGREENPLSISRNNVEEDSTLIPPPAGGVWQISEDVNVLVNRRYAPPIAPAIGSETTPIFPNEPTGLVNDIDRLEVQVDLTE